ncbi:enoyl-CoA hydratase-related protein [Noviherbaspirillum sp. CPCC 100848]|uniref:Enoyl-CoA hydratase-related protein n=1 Tax=Noviherbaspirillum album TaxID=3080276 RepID=A0ABU6J529_9BURK|nr:enoyl-CoA hydratase-related protein [Noviherbaspirillum sp. CPCC 100848]MEC4718733.1 enoyl-CoA hydratase-related protein [Noviherbaspirillum sp. CPCC 100848]
MSDIRIERDGQLARVWLSNPGKLNAVDVAMWKRLREVFSEASADDTLRCIVVGGEDGNFAAGADIEEFAAIRGTLEQGVEYHTELIGKALTAIAECRHPTIAAIEGVCVGGGLEIASACDIRIASPQARFGIPINRLGFALAPGEMQHLLNLIGKAAALEILLEGRVFDAAEAKEKGLISRLAEDVPAAAMEAARRIAQGAPLAARMNKVLARRLSSPVPLSEQEMQAAFALLDSQDYREGIASFLEKRKPDFKGL